MPNYIATVTFRDAKDKKKALTAHGTFADDATANTRITALVAAAEALSLGTKAEVKLTKIVSQDGTIPSGNIDVEVLGTFTFRHAQGHDTQISVPAFDEASFVPHNSVDIDQSDINVIAFVDEVTDGGWTDYRWSDITQLIAATREYGG